MRSRLYTSSCGSRRCRACAAASAQAPGGAASPPLRSRACGAAAVRPRAGAAPTSSELQRVCNEGAPSRVPSFGSFGNLRRLVAVVFLLIFNRCLVSSHKKCTASARFWHENRGIPRMEPRLGSSLRADGFFSTRYPRSRTQATRRRSLILAFPVGHFGFCARIDSQVCTFSKPRSQ